MSTWLHWNYVFQNFLCPESEASRDILHEIKKVEEQQWPSCFFMLERWVQGTKHCGDSRMLLLIHRLTLLAWDSSWAPARSFCWISFPDSWTRCIFSSMMEGTSFTFIQPVFACPACHPSSFPNCLWAQVPAPDTETTVHPYSDLIPSSHSTVSLNPCNYIYNN